jgi:hypothetical protein
MTVECVHTKGWLTTLIVISLTRKGNPVLSAFFPIPLGNNSVAFAVRAIETTVTDY